MATVSEILSRTRLSSCRHLHHKRIILWWHSISMFMMGMKGFDGVGLHLWGSVGDDR